MSITASTTFEILNVGTELLLGDIVNTDATFLAEQLAELGFSVFRQTVVGDHPGRLTDALREAYTRADAVILTGGLGPTCDDLTKEVAAAFFGLPLVEDPTALSDLEAAFRRLGKPMTENNRKQALLPRGAVLLRNDWGTAPGVFYEEPDGRRAFCLLPGPPGELQPLFENRVRPLLLAAAGCSIRSLHLHLRGIGESAAEALLRPLMDGGVNPTVAPYVGSGDIRIRVTARAESPEACDRMNREMKQRVLDAGVAPYFYYETNSTGEARLMPQLAAVRTLRERHLTVAAAESCTAGLVAAHLADIPGSSAVLLGGVVAYANEIKERLLGVRPETLERFGAVSAETAGEMAAGVRRVTGASVGVSTTGVAGPDGGTAETPVGTVWFGVATENGVRTVRKQFNPRLTRDEIRRRAAAEAIHLALATVR